MLRGGLGGVALHLGSFERRDDGSSGRPTVGGGG